VFLESVNSTTINASGIKTEHITASAASYAVVWITDFYADIQVAHNI